MRQLHDQGWISRKNAERNSETLGAAVVSDLRFNGHRKSLSSAMNLFRIWATGPDLLRFPFCYFQGTDPDRGSPLPVCLQHQADASRPGIAEYLPEHCHNIFHRVDVIIV